MSILDDLRRRRREAADEAVAWAKSIGNRMLTDNEQQRFDGYMQQIDMFDGRISDLAGTEQRSRSADDAFARLAAQRPGMRTAVADRDLDQSFRSAILERNPRPIDVHWDEPRSYYQPGIETRDLLTSSPADLHPVSFYSRLVEHMVESSSILAAGATLITTDSGEPLRVPRSTALSSAGIVAEGAPIPESDPTLGVVTLGAFKYGVLIQISTEMAQDSGVDLPGYLARETGQAIGLALGAHLITGIGTNQPRGVVTDATAGVTGPTGTATDLGAQGTVGQGTDLLNDLYASIIEPYTRGPGVAWLMRSQTLGIIRRLKAATSGELVGNVILTPPTVPGAAANLLDKPVFVDAGVATPAASAKSIVFGDFSRYFVRMVNGVRFERSDDFAFDQDMITFRCLLRADAALVDTTGAVKYYVHSAT